MRNVVFIFSVFVFVIIISSCSAKVNNQTVTDEKAQSQTDSVIESTKANDSPQFSLIQREYFGTIAKASVNDNDVNIRLHPNISAEKIGKVNKGEIVEIRGFSINKEIIDGYNGYWLKVSKYPDSCGRPYKKPCENNYNLHHS